MMAPSSPPVCEAVREERTCRSPLATENDLQAFASNPVEKDNDAGSSDACGITSNDGSSPELSQIITKIQTVVCTRRIRLADFFRDFDSLRRRRVTRSQLVRILDDAGVRLTGEELQILSETYQVASGRGAGSSSSTSSTPTEEVWYDRFVEEVNSVFRTSNLEKQPNVVPLPPGAILPERFTPRPIGLKDQNVVDASLRKLKRAIETTGLVFKYCYADADKFGTGWVTPAVFKKHFPFKAVREVFAEEEVDLLISRFSGDNGDVNYRYIDSSLSDQMTVQDEPVPQRRTYKATVPERRWQLDGFSPEQKLKAAVSLRQVDVRQFFLDFDKLRRGICSARRVRSTLEGALALRLQQEDWDYLAQKYSRPDEMFAYQDLCKELEDTVETLQVTPTNTQGVQALEFGRRNRMELTEAENRRIDAVEEEVGRQVRNTRSFLFPRLQDFSRGSGHETRRYVTRSQFVRALSMGSLHIESEQIDLLCLRYCNMGNTTDFDYLEFCRKVEEPLAESAPPVTSNASRRVSTVNSRARDVRRRRNH